VINSHSLYTPIFDLFAMELKNKPEYNNLIPENVKKTKRIFPYLYSIFYATKKFKAANELFENFKSEEDEEQNEAYFYKKASMLLARAYSSYCDENYPLSCTAFGESIPYWQKFYALHNMPQDGADCMIGLIRLLQGLSAMEFDYDYAKNIFNESIGDFYGDYVSTAFYSHCFIAETYYRQNEINLFIDYMNSVKNNLPQRESIDYSIRTIVAKGFIIEFEYNRLSKSFVYSTPEDIEQRNIITELITNAESDLPNDSEGRYVRKTLIRYKEIMAKNLLEIKAVGFDKYSASTKHYIKLKKHEDDQVIQTPQWLVKTNPNDNTVKLEVQPIAAVRNEKIRIQVIVSAQGTPADIIGEYKLTGYDTVNKIGFNVVAVKKNKSNLLIECESDKEISKTVGIFLLDIKWHLIKPERKENSSIIKDFYLGNTQHTIYIVRQLIEEPCYWKIVEHTCDWMKNLSESDLDDDNKVVDAIWDGCSKENLAKLEYSYKYPWVAGDPNTLAELLDRQKGACGLWSEFFMHCLKCHSIDKRKIYKLGFWNEKNAFSTRFKFYDKYNGIGNPMVPPGEPYEPFREHVVIGYNGSYNVDNKFYKGRIYDPVFHINCLNKTTEYEDATVESIEVFIDDAHKVWKSKTIGTKEMVWNLINAEDHKELIHGRGDEQ